MGAWARWRAKAFAAHVFRRVAVCTLGNKAIAYAVASRSENLGARIESVAVEDVADLVVQPVALPWGGFCPLSVPKASNSP